MTPPSFRAARVCRRGVQPIWISDMRYVVIYLGAFHSSDQLAAMQIQFRCATTIALGEAGTRVIQVRCPVTSTRAGITSVPRSGHRRK